MSLGEVGGWVLDVAALTEIADGTVFAAALVDTAAHRGLTLLVPVTALAAVYAARPSAAARERLAAVRDERGGWLLSMLADVPADLLSKLTDACGDPDPRARRDRRRHARVASRDRSPRSAKAHRL
jgi:hypothetical protein